MMYAPAFLDFIGMLLTLVIVSWVAVAFVLTRWGIFND